PEATEPELRVALASRPRWHAVHFGCHGVLDERRPVLSALALTPSASDDGMLTTLDVFGLSFHADLVTLSACESAKGDLVRGEGVVGLVRAFMSAGTPRVVATLWEVGDEAAFVFTTKFYARWKAGLPAARALRETQAELAADPRGP